MGVVQRGGKNHKKLRSAKNKASGKYVRQRIRTEANKAKRLARHKKSPTITGEAS